MIVTWTNQNVTNLESKASKFHILLQNIQHANHLREDEDSMSSLLQSDKELIQQEQLSTPSDQGLVCVCVCVCWGGGGGGGGSRLFHDVRTH